MFKEVFAIASVAFWPSLGLVLFFAVMCGACIWVLRRGSVGFYNEMAGLVFLQTEEILGTAKGRKEHKHE